MHTTQEQQLPNQVFVAYLDILGFSNFIENTSHKEAVSKYQIISIHLQKALAHVANIPTNTPWFKTSLDHAGRAIACANLEQINIHSLVVSDSIILWTSNRNAKALFDLIVTVKTFMLGMFYAGLPLRGAITYGNLFYLSRQVQAGALMIEQQIIGKPLVEAAKLERNQIWTGCIIDHKAVQQYEQETQNHGEDDDIATLSYLEKRKIVIKYQVPMKSPASKTNCNGTNFVSTMYVLNWTQDKMDEQSVKKAFEMHNKLIENDDKKIQNTIQFLKDINMFQESM